MNLALLIERQHTQAALRESEERLRRAVSIDSVGVSFFRLDGPILDANAALARMTGYTQDELRRIPDVTALTPPEFAGPTERAVAELSERGVTAPYEKQ